jgi:enoyl-CoA hydratase/carnithine racemase
MDYETVILEKGEIAKIVLNRPEKLNALNRQLKNELASAIREVKEDSRTRVLILTGAGNAFSAGQDITETVVFKVEDARQWIEDYAELYNEIRTVDVPIIASIKGYAIGAGLQIALLTDIRIAASDAKLGMTEIDVGIPCILGSGCLIMVGMPFSKAVELTLTGDLINGKDAEKFGIVNKAVPAEEVDMTTEEISRKIASKPTVAEKINKSWFRRLTSKMVLEAIEFAVEGHTKAYASGEPQEAMRSFLEKRKSHT